jgi:hypothetical protein
MYVSYPRLFTEARRRGAWKGTSLKSVTIGSKQSHGHLLIQRRIPSEHPSHSVGYPGSGSVFEHVSGSTRLEGVRETRRFVDGGQDEHEGLRAGSSDTRVRSERYLVVIWKGEGVSISTHLLPQPEKYGSLR